MKQVVREVLVDWKRITLEEAIFMMDNHEGEAFIDGDWKVAVFVE